MKSSKRILLTVILAMTSGPAVIAGPLIRATSVKADCAYVANSCSKMQIATMTSNDGVAITLDPKTHSYWNANGGSLTYNIYQDGVVDPLVTLTCNQPTVKVTSPKLGDSMSYLVVISGPGNSAAYWFTTGAPCKGLPMPTKK